VARRNDALDHASAGDHVAAGGAGAALPGLYPPNAENKGRYEAARKK